MNNKYKIGDCVVLRTGGPNMTVKGYNDEKYTTAEKMVDCDWFDSTDKKQSDTFHEDQLNSCNDTPLGIYIK